MSLPLETAARILIVEDNELDALLLQEALKKATAPLKLELTVAATMQHALATLASARFDVILSDLALPDCQGLDTFSSLFAQAPRTPIILLTGFESETLGLEAVRAGAQEYIVKGTMNEKALWRVISYAIERAALEKAVRDSEQRYKRLLGSVTDYIYTAEVEDGRIARISHNEACIRVTGYTPQEMESDPQLGERMLPEADRAAVIRQAAQAIAGHPGTLEHQLTHKNGSIRWVRHSVVLRVDERDRVTGYDGLISDITERKLAEIALKQAVWDLQKSREALQTANLQLIEAEKMETVGRMAAGVAHELQNPLQIMLMSLDLVAQRMAGSENKVVAEAIMEMRQATRRADGIIRGLLDFSRSDEFALEAEDLNSIVDSALALMSPVAAARRIEVHKELQAVLPPLPLDRVKVEQVIVNLLNNAMDAMPAGGTLTVTTARERLLETKHNPGAREAGHYYAGDEVIVLTVDDTGRGIPAESLHKVYEPFYTTKPTGKGTGLGLSIVRRIVDLHGGQLELANRPGGGVRARVLFRLPAGGAAESP